MSEVVEKNTDSNEVKKGMFWRRKSTRITVGTIFLAVTTIGGGSLLFHNSPSASASIKKFFKLQTNKPDDVSEVVPNKQDLSGHSGPKYILPEEDPKTSWLDGDLEIGKQLEQWSYGQNFVLDLGNRGGDSGGDNYTDFKGIGALNSYSYTNDTKETDGTIELNKTLPGSSSDEINYEGHWLPEWLSGLSPKVINLYLSHWEVGSCPYPYGSNLGAAGEYLSSSCVSCHSDIGGNSSIAGYTASSGGSGGGSGGGNDVNDVPEDATRVLFGAGALLGLVVWKRRELAAVLHSFITGGTLAGIPNDLVDDTPSSVAERLKGLRGDIKEVWKKFISKYVLEIEAYPKQDRSHFLEVKIPDAFANTTTSHAWLTDGVKVYEEDGFKVAIPAQFAQADS